MIDWQSLLETLGIFGIIAFMIKKIFQNWMNKDVEKFKHELKQEQIKYSKLYDKRAEVIEKVYELLEDFNQKMSSLVSPLQMAGDLPPKEKLKIAGQAGEKFSKYYPKKKIYFSEKINELLEKINKQFREAWIDITMYPQDTKLLDRTSQKEKWEYWKKAWKSVSEEIPLVQKEIAEEFRKILGAN